MTNKEAIKILQQLYPNGGHCWLDEQRIEAIGMAIKALQKEPVSEEQVKESLISKHDDKTCKEKGDSLTQESVSEDLEKEFARIWDKDLSGKIDSEAALNIARHFAAWQKQQLIAKAVDVTIAIPYQNGYGGNTQLVDSKEALPFGDNIKVLVIKED